MFSFCFVVASVEVSDRSANEINLLLLLRRRMHTRRDVIIPKLIHRACLNVSVDFAVRNVDVCVVLWMVNESTPSFFVPVGSLLKEAHQCGSPSDGGGWSNRILPGGSMMIRLFGGSDNSSRHDRSKDQRAEDENIDICTACMTWVGGG